MKIIAWEVTRRCYLNCKHCRASAKDIPYEGELTTDECLRFVDVVAARAKPLLILTGGEPMCRDDIYDIASHATRAGLRVVMAPCGWLLDEDSTRRLIDAGVKKISISLDGPDAESHDAFRGMEGAFEKTLAGLEAAKRAGMGFQINTTVTTHNLADLDRVYDLAVALGADLFNPFMLVPSGRGVALADQSVSPEEYERVLAWIYRKQREGPIPVRPTCAPHYQRVKRQQAKKERAAGEPEPHRTGPPKGGHPGGGHPGGETPLGGCLGGRHFLFVSHTGELQICGFLDLPAGNLRDVDLDVWVPWENSKLFEDIRDPARYRGKCGACEFLRVCRGCRARAHARTGDYMDPEPYCSHVPKKLQESHKP
ncbi:MAG: radical SAM protein [Planctomycetota bacterium]